MPIERVSRRFLLRAGAAALGGLSLGGCDRLSESQPFLNMLDSAESLTYRVQRLIMPRDRLAPEFSADAINPKFRANGSTDPSGDDYKALVKRKFADWHLSVEGLVDKPLRLSLADLRAMPARTQITRHDCVEGWSCIGQWTGVPLGHVLQMAGIQSKGRYILFDCFDTAKDVDSVEGGDSDSGDDDSGDTDSGASGNILTQAPPPPVHYYESIDLVDANHPQTILAYAMNGTPLPVPYGAPLRLRVERQLGYKMAKYLSRIRVVDSFADAGSGKGGFWEDRGYAWYAGI